MGTYRGTELVIFLIFISSYKVSSQTLTLFGNTIVIDRNESVICNSTLECVEESCNEGRVCTLVDGNLVQYGIITCDEDSSTPYCNGGLCSKIPQPACDPSAPSARPFVCPADGVFPDPTDCTRYHMCVQGSVTTNQCPRNTVYDHVNSGCKFRRRLSDCVTFNCIGREGRAIVYPADDRIYGRCIFGKPLILGRCEDYERYDVSSEKCVRNCRTGGVQPPYPGPDSCRKYVLCVEVSPRRYEPVEMSCACNEGYDKELNGCKVNAACLEKIGKPLCPNAKTNDLTTANESEEDDNVSDSSDSSESESADEAALPLIINNAGDNNNNNEIANGDDNVDGNLVNGNGNGDNSNSGNVDKSPVVIPLIINNAGSNNNNNEISNGDDNVDGNLVNGNGNGDNSNSGNVGKSPIALLIINNAGSNNTNNSIINGNDEVNGNLVNGNGNGNNSNSGNIREKGLAVVPLIINNSGSSNSDNSVSNGDDNVEGNIVNGNDNGNNDNTGNINTDKSEPRPENPSPFRIWIKIIIDWINWQIIVI